ncbi:MAG TPA: Gfo/Idh/MocA family oxidoreductase [Gammaproteobacteria bacterium]|nr:Gfo/Idh/MocA family oxidoreductase [Gammaproteobacteria bacterium]
MKKLRWGILSTAKIGRQFLIPAMHESEFAEVVAVASRERARGEVFAKESRIPHVHDSYKALLADPAVDAIYNPLPNPMHVPLSVKAIEAGKHVLCEKPLGLDAADIQPLLQAADAHPGQVVMEAFMYRFHPQWLKVRELIRDGVLGVIRSVHADFTYFNRDPANVRNRPDTGGGGLLDIGCYCVSAARLAFGREPARVLCASDIDPEFQVDRHATGVLDFAPGAATFYCSTQSSPSQAVKIIGDKASLSVENPFYRREVPSRLYLRRDNADEAITVGHYNHYVEMIDAFSRAALDGRPAPTPLSDALANMKVLDALFSSAKTGGWITVR